MVQTLLDARLDEALASAPPQVPVLVGRCGSGRTAALLRLRDRLGASRCQYIDLERVATTPERLLEAVVGYSPFTSPVTRGPAAASTKSAFEATMAFIASARTSDGGPATFLLDEVLELKTFESFPGLRHALEDVITALTDSPNRFVVATRFETRARRWLRNAPRRFVAVPAPQLSAAEVTALWGETDSPPPDGDTVAAVHALSGGHASYARALAGAMASDHGLDPVSALTAQLAPGGGLSNECRFCYELRLHRARGYGALKAILDVLAGEEPLTLTGIAQRLHRTPGSTKDYLSWLLDVDLVQADRKRYRFGDSLLRLWVRLYARPHPPSDERIAEEVRAYAVARLGAPAASPAPAPEPAGAPAGRPVVARPRPVTASIIDID
jgi:hypothetical protein